MVLNGAASHLSLGFGGGRREQLFSLPSQHPKPSLGT